MTLAPLALTMGEPAGIGGEIALKAWRALRAGGPPFFLIDDPGRLARLAERLGLGTSVETIADARACEAVMNRALPVLDIGRRVDAEPGRPDARHAEAIVGSIGKAVSAVRDGAAGAMVTNPIRKSTLRDAGFPHPGHTEHLAALAGPGARAVMMLVGADLRVVPATVHIPLARVVEALSAERIVSVGRIAVRSLRRDFGVDAPRLAVAGLNPHAGEGGMLGREDLDIVTPAVERLRGEGIDASGPFPADSLFHAAARRAYDAALCMYHDQALIPLKTLAFDEGVNATLGLPFVRTSPDHGTALDIAGRGTASPASLIAALRLAASMARRRGRGG